MSGLILVAWTKKAVPIFLKPLTQCMIGINMRLFATLIWLMSLMRKLDNSERVSVSKEAELSRSYWHHHWSSL